jgi:hypothetical protein
MGGGGESLVFCLILISMPVTRGFLSLAGGVAAENSAYKLVS